MRVLLASLALLALAPATASASSPLKFSAPVRVSAHGINSIACPASTACFAVGNGGQLAVSSNPDGGLAAWSSVDIDGPRQLTGIACPTARLCVATDAAGNLLSSTMPLSSPPTWRSATIDREHHLNGISCPSPRLCVAIDRFGGVLSTADPTGPARAWRRIQLPRADRNLQAITCPSTVFCVATDADQYVIVSSRPTGAGRSWRRLRAVSLTSRYERYAHPFLESVACSSARLCVGGGVGFGSPDGVAFTSTAPARSRPWRDEVWMNYPHEDAPRLASACRSDGFCVLVMDNGDGSPLVLSQAGTHGWKNDAFPGEQNRQGILEAVGCAPRGLCVIGDSAGNVIVAH